MRAPTIRLRTVAALVGAGAAAGAVAGLTFIGLVERGPEPRCSSGMEGLGCALAAVAASAVLALLLATGTNCAVLRGSGVDHAGPVGVLSVVALVAWSIAIDQMIGDVELQPLMLTVPLAGFNLLLFAVLQLLPRERWAVPAVAIGVIALAWPLTGLSGKLESNRYEADQARKIGAADFEVYEPLAVDGYSSEALRLLGPFADDQTYAEWTAFGPEDFSRLRDHYTVRTFHVSQSFDPPTNCGHDRPSDHGGGWRCTEVARTDRGEPVYVDPGATFSNVQVFFVRRGTTLITINTGVQRGLTTPQVVDLVNRLEPAA